MSHSFTPLTPDQQDKFSALANSLNELQAAWIAGYMAALTNAAKPATLPTLEASTQQENAAIVPGPAQPVTILYGSRTGNGQGLAKQLEQELLSRQIPVALKNMTDYKVRDLAKEQQLVVIVSTHGEGEPPFEAKEFYDFIHGKRAPKLQGVKFAVLGLGDSSYFHFCKTGKDVDTQLELLGATRVMPATLLDVDFKSAAPAWIQQIVEVFSTEKAPVVISTTSEKNDVNAVQASQFSAQHPFKAKLLERVNLHGRGSDRTTIHLELDAAGLQYEPGDAAGIWPVNRKELVNHLLSVTQLKGDAIVSVKGEEISLSEALRHHFELTRLTPDVIQRYQAFHPQERLKAVLDKPEVLRSFIAKRDILDLFRDYPTRILPDQLVGILRPLQPRLYSIASSPKAVPGELHLTVGVVDFESNGRNKKGVCSNYLADEEQEVVPVFIEKNPNFRLPDDPSTPIIMIGAGTGIAPFRAFMQEREADEHPGKNWLIFGNRNFETEFLYQLEWQQYIKSGLLTRMDVAFSRDSEKKIYVQHRILQHAAEIYQWIQDGAYIYICGDMKKMAGDVQIALRQVIAEQGGLSADVAENELFQLQKQRRLQLDVY